jgi:hypothetical protein
MDGGRVIINSEVLMKMGLVHHLVDEVCCWYSEEAEPYQRFRMLLIVIVRDGSCFTVIRAAQDLRGDWTQMAANGTEFSSLKSAIGSVSKVEAEKLNADMADKANVRVNVDGPSYKCARCELVFAREDPKFQVHVHLATLMSINAEVCGECIGGLYVAFDPIMRYRAVRGQPEKRGRNIIV